MKWWNGCFVLKPSGRNREIVRICLFDKLIFFCVALFLSGRQFGLFIKIFTNFFFFYSRFLQTSTLLRVHILKVEYVLQMPTWDLSGFCPNIFKCPPLNSIFTKFIPFKKKSQICHILASLFLWHTQGLYGQLQIHLLMLRTCPHCLRLRWSDSSSPEK